MKKGIAAAIPFVELIMLKYNNEEFQFIILYPYGIFSYYNISIYPSVPCTRIRCPSFISLVAFSTPTTAGKPYSRAITAPWVISPPTSVTRPFMDKNNGVQLGRSEEHTSELQSLAYLACR